jgi:hypothetical protein
LLCRPAMVLPSPALYPAPVQSGGDGPDGLMPALGRRSRQVTPSSPGTRMFALVLGRGNYRAPVHGVCPPGTALIAHASRDTPIRTPKAAVFDVVDAGLPRLVGLPCHRSRVRQTNQAWAGFSLLICHVAIQHGLPSQRAGREKSNFR